MTYDESVINVGEGMNLQSGTFTAPISGYYFFSFSGLGYDEDSFLYADVRFYKNGEFLFYIRDFGSMKVTSGTFQTRNLAYSWITKLQEGDSINLCVFNGQLWADSYQRITFNGQLLLKSK